MSQPQPASPHASALAPSLLSPSLRTLIGLAAAVIALAGMYFGRELIGPLALAAVIVIIVQPTREPLVRRGWPSWLATTAVIAFAYVILAVMALLLVFAGAQFVKLVGDYADELQQSATDLIAWLSSLGLDASASDATASVLQPANLIALAGSIGSSALAVLTAFFFILAYVIFMAADAARYRSAADHFGEARRPTLHRIQGFNRGVRRYFTVNASFGAIVAVIDGLALWALGVPAPAVWAILAFVTNFVPNIGFVLGVIPPALMALVVGGWPMMLAVIAIYSVVNVVLQVLVQPKFVSDAVNLTLTLSFFSVIFWTFIIGPLGAILSIPLTLFVRALVLEGDRDSTWLRWLSGDPTAVPPAPEPAPTRPPARRSMFDLRRRPARRSS